MEHLIKTEKELIRNLFINPEYLRVIDNTPEEFSDIACRLIYQKMKYLDGSNKPIDIITVSEGFKEQGYFEFIKELMIDQSMPVDLKYLQEYSEIIRKNAISRKVKAKAQVIQELDDFDKLVKSCNELPALANYSTNEDELNAYDGAMDFYNRLNEKKAYIKTGFKTIDKRSYITKGDYIVIGARPSVGKTAFSLQIASNLSDKHNVVFFSLETSKEKIYDRLMANISGLNMNKIKEGNFSEQELDKILSGIDKLKNKKITVVNAGGYTVEKIKSKALKLKADIIIIDYLGLIVAKGNTRYEKITNISVDLHTMAQEFGITVVALSQLRRNNNSFPTMEDLRESGQIEQDADMIILLHNDDKEADSDNFKVIISKNKEGLTGSVTMKYYKNTQKFCENF